MKNISVYYAIPRYRSHARVGNNYLNYIREKYNIVTDIENSDIVIVHHEPSNYEAIYNACPALYRKYVIGYCVWEASELPEAYKRSISYIQEIWTCSRYCCDIFKKCHPCVNYIPHPIHRPMMCNNIDRQFVRQAIDHRDNYIYYLTITKSRDKRKNLQGLVRTFQSCSHLTPRARLIVKTNPNEPALPYVDNQIIYLPGWYSESQVNALYELADIYVSLHHAEGWGLTLSDAMIFQKPVIATGYSGNLEFMNDDNSFLVAYSEENIRPNDCFGHFHSGMKWAYPDEQDATQKIHMLYEAHQSGTTTQKLQNASEKIKMFSPSAVKGIIHQRLEHIVTSFL